MNISYLRVSTKEQCEQRQRQNISNSGIKIDREYVDKQSGKNMDRPEWRKCNEALREGDRLIIDSLCRLGRDMVAVVSTCQQLKERGVTIHALKEGVTSDSTSWKLVITMMSLAAEMERERILERTNEGRAIAQKNGIKFGRKPKNYSKEL